MKLIVHAGMPKAGSTALQTWLHSHRKILRKNGVVYPKSRVIAKNHHVLLGGCGNERAVPRFVRHKCLQRRTSLQDEFLVWFKKTKALPNRSRTTMILSSETIFNLHNEDEFVALGRYLRELTHDIHVAVYVRNPADFYLSSVQQALKASHRIRPFRPISYRWPIEQLEKHVAGSGVDVYSHESAKALNGGIVEHFGTQYEERMARLVSRESSRHENVSLSAEGMALMQTYRKHRHADKCNEFTRDTIQILQALRSTEKSTAGFSSPRLHEDVKRHVNETAVDLSWLKERFSIEFSGIEYSKIGPREGLPRPRLVGDICAVDGERLQALTMGVLEHLTSVEGSK